MAFAAQGHLALSKSLNTPAPGSSAPSGQPLNSGGIGHELLVPTGRAVPAVFDRDSGKFSYFHLQKFGQKGGASISANDRFFANSGILFDLKSGEAAHTIGNSPVAMLPDGMVAYVDKLLTVYKWQEVEKVDRKGTSQKSIGPVPQASIDGVPAPREIIVAGDKAIVGCNNQILVVDLATQKIAWQTSVEGAVLSLAVNQGKLIASTDQGSIYCFGEPPSQPAGPITRIASSGADAPTIVKELQDTALAIVERSKCNEGYCLDLGCGDCQLAEALAAETDLHVVAVDTDAKSILAARQRLARRNLLGSRITVLHVSELTDTGLPKYFANLVVSQRALLEKGFKVPDAELAKLTRPYGGVSVIGKADSLAVNRRGALAGAGEWTHQYSTAGNSTCSTDEHIKGPLGMLWFRDVDVSMPQRQWTRPWATFLRWPIVLDDEYELVCVDSYNGRLIWRHPLPNILLAYNGDELMGTAGTHSIYCVSDAGIFVRRQGHCLRIDRRTGQLLSQFEAPVDQKGEAATWGYIACVGNTLIGSVADPEHVVTFRYLDRGGDMSSLLTESKTLFGMNATTGEIVWRYDAKNSIRHNAIAIDESAVYLIDRPQAVEDRVKKAKVENHLTGVMVSLDTKTGVERWRVESDVDGTVLALSQLHPVLLMTSQPTRFALDSEKAEHLTAIDPATGKQLWRRDSKYASRPMINDRTIYSEGGAWDLLTGSPLPFNFKRSYGCGLLTGSKHSMVFRSATLGYFDFERQGKVQNYGGIRPGCWINAIPAGGLVLMPDASAGCVCSYLNQSWFALEADQVFPPTIEAQSGPFRDKVEVTMKADAETDLIRFTTDGTVPNADSPQYVQPLSLTQTTTLKARTFSKDGLAGRTVQRIYWTAP
ncbi:MAG: PQQ-binding-like beta-propeller repeat protein [Pirellulales bacterium]